MDKNELIQWICVGVIMLYCLWRVVARFRHKKKQPGCAGCGKDCPLSGKKERGGKGCGCKSQKE